MVGQGSIWEYNHRLYLNGFRDVNIKSLLKFNLKSHPLSKYPDFKCKHFFVMSSLIHKNIYMYFFHSLRFQFIIIFCVFDFTQVTFSSTSFACFIGSGSAFCFFHFKYLVLFQPYWWGIISKQIWLICIFCLKNTSFCLFRIFF